QMGAGEHLAVQRHLAVPINNVGGHGRDGPAQQQQDVQPEERNEQAHEHGGHENADDDRVPQLPFQPRLVQVAVDPVGHAAPGEEQQPNGGDLHPAQVEALVAPSALPQVARILGNVGRKQGFGAYRENDDGQQQHQNGTRSFHHG